VLEKRYLRRDADGNLIETPEGLFRRVAQAIAKGEIPEHREHWEERFFNLIASLRFLPNSPTLVNAGTERGCLSACFVVSPEDTMDSIMQVAYDAAMIEKWGGGIGFGFSKLRPKNDPISTVQGAACGPIAVMKLYSKVGETLTQGAFRLGAHMGQLIVTHPDIRGFIHCKDNDEALSNFNISVQITDDFMRAVESDGDWNLINPRTGQVNATVKAKELWGEICESAWKTGDPGVVFMDRVWETQPNPQLGWIQTSNPCGEEFLENYGNCCLGSIDLGKHLNGDKTDFDWQNLEETVRTAVRFLDDVIEVNSFPLPKLREVNLATRRIGLGVMGWADALIRLHMPYDSEEALRKSEDVGRFLWDTAWNESARLAEERGPFPEYERSALKTSGYPPVRNSSVLTIAPTGTISRIASCSSGIEPHFAIAWWSNVLWEDQAGTNTRLFDAPASVVEVLEQKLGSSEKAKDLLKEIANTKDPLEAQKRLADAGIDPSLFRTSMTASPEAHVRMQAMWQKYTSNSVSKTINLPNSATVSDVADAFYLAWKTKCKAVTVYRDGSKSMQVLETGEKKGEKVQEVQPKKQERLLVPRQRPAVVKGVTERLRTGHGNVYITINFDEGGRPFEVFTALGKAGGCDSAQLEAISRLISLALRSGIDPREIMGQLRGITCCPAWDEGVLVRSTADAVALALSRHLMVEDTKPEGTEEARAAQLRLFSREEMNGHQLTAGSHCPDCSGPLVYQEGCWHCRDCGYNKCE
ncbi:MAG: adenosylcobalamin-dependent ribonucleoside-diphosphate reductase, partial [Chloroflexi bacterium]|nr:adenosylcobalamin-dependent ribonucleoside-diphosphate reductase [Chloroflexota bacterium]